MHSYAQFQIRFKSQRENPEPGASVFWHTINEFQIPKGKSRTEYAEKDIPFVSNPNGKKFESIQ